MASFISLLYPAADSQLDILESLGSTILSYLYSLRYMFHLKIYRPLIETNDHLLKQKAEYRFKSFIQLLMEDPMSQVYDSLDLLRHVHKEITEHENFQSSIKCSAHLADVLFAYLRVDSGSLRHIIWIMLMNAIRPLLSYLEKLLTYGYAEDSNEEFYFESGHCSIRTDGNFWEDCLIVRDEDAAPSFLKPLIAPLMLGIKSRLVLTKSGIVPKLPGQRKSMMECMQDLIQYLLLPIEDEETSVLNDDDEEDSGQDDFVSATQDFDLACADNIPSNVYEAIQLMPFPNTTVFDSIYYRTDNHYRNTKKLVDVMSIEFEEKGMDENDVCGADETKAPLQMVLSKSIEKVVRSFSDDVSCELMAVFKEKYLNFLKLHTDYYLLHKSSHSISVYLYSLFIQITSSTHDHSLYRTFEHDLDEKHGVRAFLVFSSEETRNPIKILNRMNIMFEDMDSFNRLLLNASTKQVLAEAFHFLLILKFAKWTMDSLKEDAVSANDLLKNAAMDMKHPLFILRFRYLHIINCLHYFVMLMLDEEISRLLENSAKGKNFNQLQESLEKFADRVAKYTFQGKSEKNQTFVQKIADVAIRLRSLFKSDDNNNQQKEVVSMEKRLHQLEGAVSHFCQLIA